MSDFKFYIDYMVSTYGRGKLTLGHKESIQYLKDVMELDGEDYYQEAMQALSALQNPTFEELPFALKEDGTFKLRPWREAVKQDSTLAYMARNMPGKHINPLKLFIPSSYSNSPQPGEIKTTTFVGDQAPLLDPVWKKEGNDPVYSYWALCQISFKNFVLVHPFAESRIGLQLSSDHVSVCRRYSKGFSKEFAL
jgi:hypothetical protein